MLLAERALRVTDSRDRYLLRRFLTHLFFLCGAFACYALVYHLFNSAPLAFIAMLLFLLHPRLYAHSFFNSKDSPFLAAFMIALYLAHRAFAKNSVLAFALLGVAVGLATNIRIMGIMLVPAVLGMRVCDMFCADGQGERRRVLATGAAFAAAAAVAIYASSPYLWNDPLSLSKAFTILPDHAAMRRPIFQGEQFVSGGLPWHYIIVWIWITTPPITLLFGALGIAVVLRRAASSPAAVFRNAKLRFALLCAACFALPIAATAALGIHAHSAWRHMHFLYAPGCILAAFALRWLPREFKPGSLGAALARWGTPALMCAGLATTAAAMIQLHPYEHVYFNFFVDRQTPERLRSEYTMDYYRTVNLAGMRRLLEIHPSGPVFVDKRLRAHSTPMLLLPESERYRILVDVNADDTEIYHIVNRDEIDQRRVDASRYDGMREIYAVNIYNSALMSVMSTHGEMPQREDKLAVNAARHREIYSAATSAQPLARAHYDVYFNPSENALVYVKEPCAFADMTQRFFLHIAPAAPDDLPEARKPRGYDNADFHMLNPFIHRSLRIGNLELGSKIEDRCLASVKLPDYPIAAISTGQFNNGGKIWTASIDFAAAEREREARVPK